REGPGPPAAWTEGETSGAADDGQLDWRQPGEAERARAGWRQVDDAALDVRAAVVDAHHDRLAGLLVRDLHHGAERQRLVRGGQPARIGPFAIGGFLSRVDRSNSGLS